MKKFILALSVLCNATMTMAATSSSKIPRDQDLTNEVKAIVFKKYDQAAEPGNSIFLLSGLNAPQTEDPFAAGIQRFKKRSPQAADITLNVFCAPEKENCLEFAKTHAAVITADIDQFQYLSDRFLKINASPMVNVFKPGHVNEDFPLKTIARIHKLQLMHVAKRVNQGDMEGALALLSQTASARKAMSHHGSDLNLDMLGLRMQKDEAWLAKSMADAFTMTPAHQDRMVEILSGQANSMGKSMERERDFIIQNMYVSYSKNPTKGLLKNKTTNDFYQIMGVYVEASQHIDDQWDAYAYDSRAIALKNKEDHDGNELGESYNRIGGNYSGYIERMKAANALSASVLQKIQSRP